ncbi:MAG: trypsin-like peptidase domain-containing protein [Planctomycetes bacterium]|nr:trypsin-like peptidase domain-containing protein [Planctomycetota bacterium]
MHRLKLMVITGLLIVGNGGLLKATGAENFEKSVVMIRSVTQGYNYDMPWKQQSMRQGVGSGLIIEGKRILTNAHNVSNYKYIELKKENIAKAYPAKVAFVGHDCDLAILTVEDESFFDDTVPLEFAEMPAVNTTVSTYGFPLGGIHISVTKGIVSRIQMDMYSHSGGDSHLVIQTDAAINPGNSGGPVMQDGKVVGVAFQGLRQAENIGYLIPTTVIEHFLQDIEDSSYDGFGSLGVTLYPGLHSASYKDYLKVPADKDGMLVTSTMMHSSVEELLEPGDVITQIDKYNINNDGMVEIYGLTLHLSEVIETKQIGEKIELIFYRQGKEMKAEATIALNRPLFEYSRQYDRQPRYVCFGGLVFIPMTRNFLETWGGNWLTDIPHYLRYLARHSMQLNEDRQRKEYVVIATIVPDEINSYSSGFKNQPVESINGITIRSIDDVYKVFKESSADFYAIKFMGNNRILPIDAKKARVRQGAILNKYHIPSEVHLEGQL